MSDAQALQPRVTVPDLAQVQRAFAAYLRSPSAEPPAELVRLLAPNAAGAEGLVVYWRSSRHAQRAALAAAYPVIAALVGDALFAALCADHLRAPGSRSGDLHRLGRAFAATVRAEPACADYPYLADVAELEWAVHRSFFQGARGTSDCVDPASIGVEQLARLRVQPASGLALLSCASAASRIWRAHQPGAGERLEDIDWRAGPEWLAVHRVAAGVCIDPLEEAEFRLLACSQQGATLAEALDQLSPLSADLASWLPRWLQLGLAAGLTLAPG